MRVAVAVASVAVGHQAPREDAAIGEGHAGRFADERMYFFISHGRCLPSRAAFSLASAASIADGGHVYGER